MGRIDAEWSSKIYIGELSKVGQPTYAARKVSSAALSGNNPSHSLTYLFGTPADSAARIARFLPA